MRSWRGNVLGGADALKMVRFAAFAADSLIAPHEPRRRLIERKGELLAAATAAVVMIAGSSYWIGMRSARLEAVDRAVAAFDRSRAMQVPQPVVTQPAPVTTPTISPTSQPDETLVAPDSVPAQKPQQASAANEQLSSAGMARATAAQASVTGKSSEADPNRGSSAQKETQTPRKAAEKATALSDQMVRIGRFATQSDAKNGWATVLHKWPGMQGLAVVPVPINSLRDGKTYYRLQVGTTSRAHSEVVCQRAHDLDQSCTVIGSDEKSGESSL
jgi:hypothetical protein